MATIGLRSWSSYMNQSDGVRAYHLLQISTDLRNRMAEVHSLRNALRLAENETRVRRPSDADNTRGDELRADA